MSHTDRIQQLLLEKPGLKAQQIASELGLERSHVASALESLARGEVRQDSEYRWWPRTGAAPALAAPRGSFLARLCRYYLECLAHESGSGISIPAGASDVDYVVLNELPFARSGAVPGNERAMRKLIRKTRQERGQLALYVGYALRLRSSPRLEEEMRIEPVLIYPVEDTPESPAELLRPAGAAPLFNLEVLKSLLTVDSGNVIDEAIQLSDELGLASPEDDLPAWDEIILRLQRCRPDWDWKEALSPYELSGGPPLGELTAAGIYNRAVLFAAPRSPFTYGLEVELRKLAQLEEDAVASSALGLWLRGESVDAKPPDEFPILELLPLNSEQRQAVVQGLTAPLTVVTGPPGTGKSQVVVSLLANMAWQGRSVVFASKNNHAVDVVESRANELGTHPLLLRLGKEEHHARLAQHLTSALAESANPGDATGYAWLVRAHEESGVRFAAVQHEIAAVVELRNMVDELERASEPARGMFGADRFAELRAFEAGATRARLETLGAALSGARDGGMLQSRRAKRVAEVGRELLDEAERLGVEMPGGEDLPRWDEFHREMGDRVEWAERARAYWDALERLRRATPLEDLARDLTRVAEESAGNSLELWRRWVRMWPSRWNPAQRKVLSEYVSLLQMIATGDRYDEGAGRRVFRRYYSLFPKVTEILPCWAVTSLSARRRLPFDAGLFDLVVIDEASQCDIASALPLLLRARRAVIIGDPLQLKHVSTVAAQQDRMLIAAHGLAEGSAAWAYSVNSLFDLARSLCRHEDIVNLRDHHRSHRDIITFSNRHFYRGGLRVATDHDTLKRPRTTGPAVRWIDVRGKVTRPARGGALNVPEAEAVIAEVRKLAVEQGYDGAIGVVTPFRAQANRIRAMAQQDAELSGRLTGMQFVVDTVHGFQGDERDVIFFSPVVSAGIGESTLRFLKNHGNLFNVAITRARSELVVVGDRQGALDSGVNYLASFAEYAHGLAPHESVAQSIAAGAEYPVVAHPEFVSDWERVFYRALYAAGLRPVPQFEEAPYTLDFALFDGERKLDIEVDGENYHRNWDGELCRRDQIRSRRLSDMGWDILRFWVYELRDDLPGCVERVKAWMAVRPM
jgi:very-short-patch-repair endonuclease